MTDAELRAIVEAAIRYPSNQHAFDGLPEEEYELVYVENTGGYAFPATTVLSLLDRISALLDERDRLRETLRYIYGDGPDISAALSATSRSPDGTP